MSQLGQNLCIQCDCRPIENKDTGLCATCGFENRRLERKLKTTKVVVPIKKITEKRAKQNREYLEIREQFLEQYPVCQVKDCQNKATEIHHIQGRANDLLTNPENFLAICSTHHTHFTTNSAEAIKEGYSKLRSIT